MFDRLLRPANNQKPRAIAAKRDRLPPVRGRARRTSSPSNGGDPERDAQPLAAEPTPAARAVVDHVPDPYVIAAINATTPESVIQSSPTRRESRLRALGGGPIVEEPVDGGPGAADVGAERARASTRLDAVDAREVVRRQSARSAAAHRGRSRRAARRRARRSRVAAAGVERGVHVAVEGFSAPLGQQRATTAKSCGSSIGSSVAAVAGPELRARVEEERDVGAEPRRELVQLAGVERRSSCALASRSAVAASELPPPSPAATGMRFSIADAPAVRSVERRSSARRRSCRREPLDRGARRRLDRDPVGERRRAGRRSAARACRRRAWPDDERQVDLRGRRRVHGERLRQRDELGRLELLGTHVRRARPMAASAATASSRDATPAERERVRERLAPVREGRLDDPLDLRGRARRRCGGTRRAPSRRSAGAGRPRARRGGSRCARRRAG